RNAMIAMVDCRENLDGQVADALYPVPPATGSDAPQGNDHRGNAVLGMLDRIGCGYLVIEGRRRVVEANATARIILGRETGAAETLEQL
ncbi:hypothetical protein, partial [Klebsiella variicola]|uniref:hypothetical protein n=1 Tax=Klebsiella variicola TaxID=244366 RepID=UPI001952F6E6